jgi:hypothetical protein
LWFLKSKNIFLKNKNILGFGRPSALAVFISADLLCGQVQRHDETGQAQTAMQAG